MILNDTVGSEMISSVNTAQWTKIWALMITTFIYLRSERTINISSYLFIIAVLQRTLFSKEVLSKSWPIRNVFLESIKLCPLVKKKMPRSIQFPYNSTFTSKFVILMLYSFYHQHEFFSKIRRWTFAFLLLLSTVFSLVLL